MKDILTSLPTFEPGSVWLAGAGPGDPGLVTLHTLNAIQQADVIVYDALVSRQILELIEQPERLEYAGKRGGAPSPRQDDITLRLIELAQKSKRVLRLKGGDPFVFGRGGEEALALAQKNIAFRIIPGITSGIGGLAYAGIPATHRSINTVVSFITGNSATDQDMDWKALSQSSPVLVFYMGLARLTSIRDNLLAAGRAPDHPIALISKAATPEQKTVITTLEDCQNALKTAAISSPVIIVVGEVANLHASLNWFDPQEVGQKAPFSHQHNTQRLLQND